MAHREIVGRDGSREMIPVVVYYRCSSPQQELSVEQQRTEVEDYCHKKGYSIIREYVDEGKSGSKNAEKREAFNKMIKDAASREFRVVVCYDAARFTRFDNLAGGKPKDDLRKNDVKLDTIKEGEFDWRTPEGRWKDQAYTEANNAASLNISRDSIRGRAGVLALGYWPIGVVPYGYDRMYTDGVRNVHVTRQESYKKGRNWHLKLVINEVEAKIVRLIFDLYVNQIKSRREIATKLTDMGVAAYVGLNHKTAGAWTGDMVKNVLTEKAYIGYAVIGAGRKSKTAHNRAGVHEKEGSCPMILPDASIWHKAQGMIAESKDGRPTRARSVRAGIFSGFLTCGHCGYKMSKHRDKPHVTYMCSSVSMRPHLGCEYYQVREDELKDKVILWIINEVDGTLRSKVWTDPDDSTYKEEMTALVNRINDLDMKVKNATESALLAPPYAREAAWKMVQQWNADLEGAKQKHKTMSESSNTAKIQGTVDQIDSVLESMRSTMPGPTDPGKLRSIFDGIDLDVQLWWESRQTGKKRSHEVKEICLTWRFGTAMLVGPGSSATTDDNQHRRFRIVRPWRAEP